MNIDVVNTENAKVGDVEVDDSVFASRVKSWLFYEVVKAQMANRRAGTQSTKTASEVRGTGKKPFKQKGTGRARQGSTRATHMRGGAVALGPKPRSYAYKVPRKMVQGALRSALSLRLSESKLHVVQGWSPESPKTKDAIKVLSAFEAQKALVVGTRDDENLRLSVRNLPNAKYLPVEGLNVYDVLKYDHLFINVDVIEGLSTRLKTAGSRSDAESSEVKE
jgi:large subunit ribosomal protein L4